MWPFNLSVRLPVFGLVGLYPANYLMGRGLILRYKASEEVPCFCHETLASWSYPVLAHLSVGYPRLEGRLPTCYSPVRRCTRGVAPTFPHDLHVLGTPPAFVLSQDQTLQLKDHASEHCSERRLLTTESVTSLELITLLAR